MNTQLIFQFAMLVGVVWSFFQFVYVDFNGREAEEPNGFVGFIASAICALLTIGVYWGAGAFSEIIKFIQR